MTDESTMQPQGMKGNDARYINHSCAPNVEVRKYQTAGAAQEEYEIGFWALRDIKQGEEVQVGRALGGHKRVVS